MDEQRRVIVGTLSKKKRLAVSLYKLFHMWLPNYIDCRSIYVRDIIVGGGFRITKVKELLISGPVDLVIALKEQA